jgi:type IV pilus assembly protein PilY1
MKRFAILLLILSVVGGVVQAGPARAANSITDYTGVPPFIATAVTPNVLILMDNSGSMGFRAQCSGETNLSPPYTLCPAFVENASYTGLFDTKQCYTYDAGNTRFQATTSKAALNTACGTTEWDGNFLNWVTFRRYDAVKKAMSGGNCAVARAADGTCPPSGDSALITLKGQTVFASNICCIDVSSPPVPTGGSGAGTGDNKANGRVPTAVQTLGAAPANLVFHVRGSGTLTGSFCVASATDGPPDTNASNCQKVAGGFTEQQFAVHVVVDTQPTGVIQELGDKVRFGLMEFKGNDGAKVLTPIGSRQSIDWSGTTLETFTTNKAAMIDAVEESFPATNTPLGESLYEGIRYVAQLNSAYSTTSYVYPIAYSPGVGLGTTGAGSLGPGEISALTGTEACPSGYIGTTTANCAAGRDPFFFGSNHTPAWASPSVQVPCCKTFLMIFTDGEPTQDTVGTKKPPLNDFGHVAHGAHCTGSFTYAGTPPPAGTCITAGNPPASLLLQQHKTDYGSADHNLDDVAYWAHITDLRQATIPVINEAGHDLPGFQNVTVYSFFAFGNINGREILMQAAKQGGFNDQNGNNLPDLQSEWDSVNNDTGALVPDGIPDTFFESQNVDDLKTKLTAAITSILARAASGTSISVLTTSTTGIGAIYQAFFFPTTFKNVGSATVEVKWTGYTQGLFIDTFGNLREDFSGPGCTGPPDGRLVLQHDCIVKIRFDPATNDVLVDRFKDDNGDGKADTTTPFQTVHLRDIQPTWEAGRRLALTDPGASCPPNAGGVGCRRILTWADISNGGGIGPSTEEFNEFRADRVAILCPYLGGANVLNCNSANAALKTAAQNEATDIINFVRGNQVAGLRDRQLSVVDDTGAAVTKVWPLGDIIHATPVVVGAPQERFDIIYGDAGYANFFRRYKDRRQVAYIGANDGMLHAFNAGFFQTGDVTATPEIEQARFTRTPKQVGTDTDCAALPCNGSVATYAFRTDAPKLGAELWGFIPQDLLPQLRWLTSPQYDHVYYVDLKPKVADVRIFPNDADHPGGWGTILIGGFRLGGSCTNCTQGKAGPRVVTADFNYDGDTTDTGSATSGSDTRVFLSSYFVLDITNPEKEPDLLWVFRDKDLGLTTAEPAVLRVNPAGDPKTSSANEKWYVVFGTGPTHHDAGSSQTAKFFVVDLKLGPSYSAINKSSGTLSDGTPCSLASPCIAVNTTSFNEAVRVFSTGQAGAFMGDAVTLDFDLDFRVEVMYLGTTICTGATGSPCNGSGPQWRGAVYRLTTNGGNPDPDTWGVASAPTTLISTFAYTTPQATTCTSASPCKVGPVTAAPVLSADDNLKPWVFFGTGRYYSSLDKTNQDIQHFFGVKDCIISGVCSDQTVERNNLTNVSSVVICSSCSPTANVSTDGGLTFNTSFDAGLSNLVTNVQNTDGWFTTLPNTRERNLSRPLLIGGTLFFTTFIPNPDPCAATGQGLLYALYYLTGSPYKESALGTTPVGSDTIVKRSTAIGAGLPSEVVVHIGAQGSGAAGTTGGSGSVGRLIGFSQTSTGAVFQMNLSAAGSFWSRIIAWRDI